MGVPFALPNLLRWSARVSSAVLALMLLFLLAGEIFAPHSGPPSTVREWLGIFLLCTGVFAALAGWVWELPAALISLGCLAAFSLVIEPIPPVLLAAIPGALFLADWLVRRPA